nr:putative phospholipid/glycerol acyltransferase [Tanacetum cinerariifolium]
MAYNVIPNIPSSLLALKGRLKSIQAKVDKNLRDASLKKELVLVLNDFVEASKDEMNILQQKAKMKCYEGEAVNEQFVKHFENFLGKVDQVASVDDSIFKNACVDLTGVSPLVGFRENGFVAGQAALKAESSKVAKHEKACLENQHAWDVVGNEVCLAIKDFFRNGKSLEEINSTLIALIPKALVYLLPITIVQDLEKLFKRFLWNAGDSAKGKARVAWKVIRKPKVQDIYDARLNDNAKDKLLTQDKIDKWNHSDDLKCGFCK